jgi:hypothetical protein
LAIDIGAQRKLINNLNIGLAMRNLGPKMKFISEGYDLPLTLAIGAGLTIGGITLALDTNYEIIDENLKISFGTEYMPLQFITFRGGYFLSALQKSVSTNDDLFEQKDGLGGGLGLNISNYSLDYAIVPYEELGTTQRISLQISF